MSHYLSVITNFRSPSLATVHLHLYRKNLYVYIFCIVFIFSSSSWKCLAYHIFYQESRTQPALHCIFWKSQSRSASSSICFLKPKSGYSDCRPRLWFREPLNPFGKGFSRAQIYQNKNISLYSDQISKKITVGIQTQGFQPLSKFMLWATIKSS